MIFVRKIGLTLLTAVFGLVMFAATTNAQHSRTRYWSGNRTVSVQPGSRTRAWQYRNHISPSEYRRLQRQRYRIYRSTNRAYRDGRLTPREQWRISRQYNRYNRSTVRARNW